MVIGQHKQTSLKLLSARPSWSLKSANGTAVSSHGDPLDHRALLRGTPPRLQPRHPPRSNQKSISMGCRPPRNFVKSRLILSQSPIKLRQLIQFQLQLHRLPTPPSPLNRHQPKKRGEKPVTQPRLPRRNEAQCSRRSVHRTSWIGSTGS